MDEIDKAIEAVIAQRLARLALLKPTEWGEWSGTDYAPVWQWVALTLELEPLWRLVVRAGPPLDLHPDHTLDSRQVELLPLLMRRDVYATRLGKVLGKMGGGEPTKHRVVRCAEVLAIADGFCWTVPAKLRIMADPADACLPAVVLPAPVAAPAEAMPVLGAGAENTEARQERRYQACIDARLSMPTDTYAHMPRGIGRVAKREGITRQAFTEDVRAHIGRLHGR